MQMVYIFTQVAAKTSICCFYSRVFTTITRIHLITRGFILFLLIHGLVFTLLIVFQCLPVQSIWDRSIEGQCLNISAIGYAGAACSILEDVVLFVIPIPELLKLQLSRKKKIALVFMFSVASFACIASMIRLKYMVSYANTYDATWDNVEIVLWSSIELNSAIVCGSLPALLPLFRIVSGYFSRIMTTMQSKHHRRPEEPIDEGKESFSQASGTSSEASSPQKSIRAKTFGNVSAANDLRIVGHMSARTDGRDDLEHQDWITGRSTS
ncbi:uncharacterized protein CTRU02_200595 [Colletotrichum truncatum]|uniref:Integral membrane protein n=1 Tax=Colletotrichum truncatum TaxID=5467 RepID=A0ACC3ZF47_COLTU